MKTLTYLFAFTILVSACSTRKRISPMCAGCISITADGSSFERAIFIKETHEQPGIDAEYAWIRAQYPSSKVNGQALLNHNGKPYDLIHITTADGTNKDVYFDISNFYGKF